MTRGPSAESERRQERPSAAWRSTAAERAYWLAAGVLCAVIAASANAWVLQVEVIRDERYGPPAEPPGQAAPGSPGGQSG